VATPITGIAGRGASAGEGGDVLAEIAFRDIDAEQNGRTVTQGFEGGLLRQLVEHAVRCGQQTGAVEEDALERVGSWELEVGSWRPIVLLRL
jgi:hypothetical protein